MVSTKTLTEMELIIILIYTVIALLMLVVTLLSFFKALKDDAQIEELTRLGPLRIQRMKSVGLRATRKIKCDMRRFKKISLIAVVLLSVHSVCDAQTGPVLPSVINASGGYTIASDGNLYDFNVGEVTLVSTFSTGNYLLSQGFLQPFYLDINTNLGTDIQVVQNVSPNGDGYSDFLYIKNIEKYPINAFYLYNRYGNEVFSINNYDNKERVFRGVANTRSSQLFVDNTDLPDGTYFYVLEVKDIITTRNTKNLKGFIVIKRK